MHTTPAARKRCVCHNVLCVLVHHRCALSGLLAGGLKPDQLIAVSRNPGGAPAQAVARQGVEVRVIRVNWRGGPYLMHRQAKCRLPLPVVICFGLALRLDVVDHCSLRLAAYEAARPGLKEGGCGLFVGDCQQCQ